MTISIFGTPAELTDFFKMMSSDVLYIEDEEDGDGDGGEDGGEVEDGDEKFNEFAPEV